MKAREHASITYGFRSGAALKKGAVGLYEEKRLPA